MYKTLPVTSDVQSNEVNFLHQISRDYHVMAKHGRASELYNALNDHSVIAITNKEGILTYVNNKFCLISQYSSEELIGNTHRINKSDYHPDSYFAGMWQTITKGEIWEGEIKNRAKHGSYYWVQTVIVPLVDKQW
jgi:PAS domain S-box-containing protein